MACDASWLDTLMNGCSCIRCHTILRRTLETLLRSLDDDASRTTRRLVEYERWNSSGGREEACLLLRQWIVELTSQTIYAGSWSSPRYPSLTLATAKFLQGCTPQADNSGTTSRPLDQSSR